jgi:multidrug efflux pump subunit AcrB
MASVSRLPTDHHIGGGLAAWSIRHPVGVVMLALAVLALGAFAYGALAVDLLPRITYPEVRVRVVESNVPAQVMEDRVTRIVEEQLAVTEDAIAVQSRTSEGSSAVDLAFAYGTDIDRAFQDASARLDRAKRLLPEGVETPSIFKFSPSQLPVVEFALSSSLRDAVALRGYADHDFAKWFLNLPGVAAVETGGGLVREIQVLADAGRLAALGLTTRELVAQLRVANRDEGAGRLRLPGQEMLGRATGRFTQVAEIAALPLRLADGRRVPLAEVAEVRDTHADERTRTRLNGVNAVKVSIQKQPDANTVAVVEAVNERLALLQSQNQLPPDLKVLRVGDEAVYVKNALAGATSAALGGATLAMLVVYLFLGDLRRTLIVGSAIPLGVLVTFALMELLDLSLNMMTLGGLALGVGLLVDNTIVMLENIQRHQRAGDAGDAGALAASAEVTSAVTASTTTNLAAVLPFVFLGGLTGLLFRELVFTISAAIAASLVVALTLVPALAARLPQRAPRRARAVIERALEGLQQAYARLLGALLGRRAARITLVVAALAALWAALPRFGADAPQTFLPDMDDGRILVSLSADAGTALEDMDRAVRAVERIVLDQAGTETALTIAGGFIFGRIQREVSHRSSISVRLKPLAARTLSSSEWIARVEGRIAALHLAGVRVHVRLAGIRGLRLSRGEEAVSLRVQGAELAILTHLGDAIVARLKDLPELRGVAHSQEELRDELGITLDRERAAAAGVTVEEIGLALRAALDGVEAGDFFSDDRAYELRVRLPQTAPRRLEALEGVIVKVDPQTRQAIHLGDVARLTPTAAPGEILRDNQVRIIEINASLAAGVTPTRAREAIEQRLADFELPAGYTRYDAGAVEALKEGRNTAGLLLGLGIFLVFVVMAVQYESLRDPFVILLGVPFTLIGVAWGLSASALPLSMPVWLGLILLAGIVVNNSILLVEFCEQMRARGLAGAAAVTEAARLRLRPILMTTLTAVVGLLPLALGATEGGELLQPLAVTMVWGLSFSMLVSLLLVPVFWLAIARP